MKSSSFISCLSYFLLLSSLSYADPNDKNQTDQSQQEQSDQKDSKTKIKDTNQDYNLDSIITSATGFSQDKKDAPASISVITSEEILTRPIKDLGDAIQDVPGVYVEQTKTGQNQISMRGLGSAYTLILIDGRRQNVNGGFDSNGFNGAHSSFMPPASMIERVEVIRGPASVIYGTDAMGGVINIITKKNPKKITGAIQLNSTIQEQRANFGDNYGINLYLASPIIKDKLFFDMRGAYQYNGANYFYSPIAKPGSNPYTTHSPGKWHSYNSGARLSYVINDGNTIYFDAEHYHITNTTLNTSSKSTSATNDFNKTNLVINHDGKYYWGKTQSYIQYTLTDRIPQLTSGYGNVTGPLNYSSLIRNQDIVLNSTINSDFDLGKAGEISLTTGIYYLYENLVIKSQDFDRGMHQFAIFGEGQYFINDYISTTLGLRYNYANLYAARPNPRFYININPTKWFTIKAGIASGMRIPALTQSYNGLYNIDNSGYYYYGTKDLQAEKSWNYELSSIFDLKKAYMIFTGYYTDFTDQIQTNTTTQNASIPGGFTCSSTTGCYYFSNIGKSMMAGFEASIQTKAFYGFSLDTTYAFTYTRQLSGSNYGLAVNSIPKHKFMAKINYRYENLSTYLRMQGNFQTPTLPSKRGGDPHAILGQYYKDYILLDWALSYRFLKFFTATFSINNLLNTNFIDFALDSKGSSYVNSYQRYLPGRNYWFSLRMEF